MSLRILTSLETTETCGCRQDISPLLSPSLNPSSSPENILIQIESYTILERIVVLSREKRPIV
jgi:hypothetical protein